MRTDTAATGVKFEEKSRDTYEHASDVLKRMGNAIEKIQNGEYCSIACRQEGLDYQRFRHFLTGQWLSNDKERAIKTDDILYSWEEEFLKDVFGEVITPAADFHEDYEYVLSTLTDREQEVIRMTYEHSLTLEEMGKSMGVTRERVRQVLNKALRKLRHPDRRMIFENGVGYATELKRYKDAEKEQRRRAEALRTIQARRKELEEKTSDLTEEKVADMQIEGVKIDDMGLSVRAYCCLKRANINYLDDLSNMTVKKLACVRNLGRKSLDEILASCREYGITLKEED